LRVKQKAHFLALHCYTDSLMILGFATAEGTARYRDRFEQLREAEHFRQLKHVLGAANLWLSSIGLGTYLGEPDDAADASYTDAIRAAVRSGINVLDTAINYRHQRSERNIGAALNELVSAGQLQRDEVLVCTKAGYLSFDGNLPTDPRKYFVEEYVETGIVNPKDLAGGMHCIAPAYLENQIERSRQNLGLETIDVFYLHNPETQLADVSPEMFQLRLRHAFESLERQVKEGKIRYYGMATWNAFRVPDGFRDYISLPASVEIAREVAGESHHFRFIQLPFNLAMPEAFGLANQTLAKKNLSVLSAARQLGIAVIGSATLYQGRLAHSLPSFIRQTLGMKTDPENAIQFARSTPGLTTALIGMGNSIHVAANLKPALLLPARLDEWSRLFSKKEVSNG
jgi:aryl-alcohol dehydrogenase-like predicted oxidoreductase